MDAKIQKLTEKLYFEGVEKGREEAALLAGQAKKEKDQILQSAYSEAESIVAEAHKNATELRQHTESELKMYTAQALNALKSEIVNLLSNKIASTSVHSAFDDKDFMQQIILKLVSEWSKNERLLITVTDADALKQYMEHHAKQLLSEKIVIEQINGRNTSFSIAPVDGSYKINFGENEFIDYFKTYLRPQLIELLF